MSFLIDPPLLYSGGRAYARATRNSDPSRAREVAVGADLSNLALAGHAPRAAMSRRVSFEEDRRPGREPGGGLL